MAFDFDDLFAPPKPKGKAKSRGKAEVKAKPKSLADKKKSKASRVAFGSVDTKEFKDTEVKEDMSRVSRARVRSSKSSGTNRTRKSTFDDLSDDEEFCVWTGKVVEVPAHLMRLSLHRGK